ncbi:MAG TPA: helix-turn-helix transcriptional regulator, partial [Allocoleopsis sp.]
MSRSGIELVRQKIGELGLSYEEFAKLAHISKSSIERALAGQNVSDGIKEAIAQALNLSKLDLTDPHGTRFLNWDEIRQNSVNLLPPLLTDLLVDRIGRELDWSESFIDLTIHQRKKLPSYLPIFRTSEGSYLHELSAAEIEVSLTTENFINDVLKLNQPLSSPKHTVVVGVSGNGKSALLHRFVRIGLNFPNLTIIYVPLSETENKSVDEYLDSWLEGVLRRPKDQISELEKKALIGRFREGRVLLLLDCENSTTDARSLLNWLGVQLKGWVGFAHVVLVCQPNLWNIEQNPLSRDFQVFCLS